MTGITRQYLCHKSKKVAEARYRLGFMSYFVRILEAPGRRQTVPLTQAAPKPKELSEREKTRISEIEKKSTKLGYRVKIRLVYLGNDRAAKLRHAGWSVPSSNLIRPTSTGFA